MASTTSFNWETPDDTDLVKDGAAAIRTLGNSIDTSMTDLLGGTTGQVLAKASNTNMDFTWVAQDDSNAIQNAIVDAKGDLIAATAADTPARLAVGTNGQVLTADSTAATGLTWATPAGGGGMTLLSTTTISGTTTISSISGSYKHLLLNLKGMTSTVDGNSVPIRFNGDSGGNYYHAMIRAIGSTVVASFDNADTNVQVIPRVQSTSTVGKLGSANVWIMRYTDTNYIDGFCQAQGHDGTNGATFHKTFRYDCSAAITSITILNDSGTVGGTAYLYGVN